MKKITIQYIENGYDREKVVTESQFDKRYEQIKAQYQEDCVYSLNECVFRSFVNPQRGTGVQVKVD